jgi:hypothetical protein
VRLRVVHHTDKDSLVRHVQAFPLADAAVFTDEGMWTTVCNFLRTFRGVHKKYLGGYVAMYEFGINLTRITPAFISALVTLH